MHCPLCNLIAFIVFSLIINLLGLPTLVGNALSFTHERSFFYFYQSTALSSHAVDGHQMYFGGAVVRKASTVGIEISPIPPLIFTEWSKSAKFGIVFNVTQL